MWGRAAVSCSGFCTLKPDSSVAGTDLSRRGHAIRYWRRPYCLQRFGTMSDDGEEPEMPVDEGEDTQDDESGPPSVCAPELPHGPFISA